jgi:arylsulfatase A-like enzyme
VKNGPNSLGFDYSFIVPGSLDMSPYVYLENGKATAIPDSISPRVPFPAYTRMGEIAPDFTHQTALDKLTQKAVNFIREQAESSQPFFLYFPMTGPHKPALTAERFAGSSGFGPYGDLVVQVDWTVGQVINALETYNLKDNTIVIYTSDNGSYMYRIDEDLPDHLADASVQGFHAASRQSNYIWRGTKADIYDGGHRVPFIVRWPGHVRSTSTNAGTICLTDVKATLAEIVGGSINEETGPDSFSFLPLLEGKQEIERAPIIHHSVNGTFSIRYGKWKLIFSDGSGGRQKPVGRPFQEPYQLFDMVADPSETKNVLEQYPEVVKILTGYLDLIRTSGTSHVDLAG